ncbi:MAG TPA: carboxypeptidase regulatory-like domain-containing protein [Rhodanobacteraceae bacterium]
MSKYSGKDRSRGFRQVALAGALLMALGSVPVWAQSITGGLFGQAKGDTAATVVINSPATGFIKTIQSDASGNYSLTGLNPGKYVVTVKRDGQVLGVHHVTVVANVQAQVYATSVTPAAANAQKLSGVTVSAIAVDQNINPIDVSTPELASTYSMALVDQLPTGRSVGAIAELSSAVHYDNQTTGLPQFGGASSAENRYYYNEFDTTYSYTGIGATKLPSEALSSVQTLPSNAGVSWTSSTGGIISSTVRQGTNQFKAGYSMYFTPGTSHLEERQPNSYDSLGNYYHFTEHNTHGPSFTQYLWASGAIVKDKLFFFGMLGNEPASQSTSFTNNRQFDASGRDKNALLNLTWNITNNQSFNVVGYRDWNHSFNNQYTLDNAYDPTSKGDYFGWSDNQVKTQFLIANYHWYINENMSLRVMGGYLSSTTLATTNSTGSGLPYVTSVDANGLSTNIGITTTPNEVSPFQYWRRGFKADFDWVLGDHTITIGAEHYKRFVNRVTATTSGGDWTYYDRPGFQLANGNIVPGSGAYVEQFYKKVGGAFYSVDKSAYISDKWQVADRWIAYLGVRDDYFINKNGAGQNFYRQPILSPRLGVAWDVDGDGTFKIGANAGKYTIPLPGSVNTGAASATTTWQRYYTYTGMDPATKAPTGTRQIGNQVTLVNGLAPQTYNITTGNLKPPYQYEFQVYAQKMLGNAWSGKVSLGYSVLKRTIDDACTTDIITDWAQSHGYPNYVDTTGCPEVNPGIAQTFIRDYNGDGKLESLTIPGALVGPPPIRHYYHATVELVHQRTPDAPYFLDVGYTWAHLYGNYDGMINLTQRTQSGPSEQTYWDFPGLMEHGTGDLSSDVRGSLKINGVYYFSNGLRVSGILDMATGTPLSCMGTYPDVNNPAHLYGSSSHYCNREPAPLGNAGRLPFFWNLNLGVGYDWKIDENNLLSVDLQMQNVTNRHGQIDANQTWDQGFRADGSTILNPAYGAATWQTPRTTMLILRYQFH